jgi:hypothetical protein
MGAVIPSIILLARQVRPGDRIDRWRGSLRSDGGSRALAEHASRTCRNRARFASFEIGDQHAGNRNRGRPPSARSSSSISEALSGFDRHATGILAGVTAS